MCRVGQVLHDLYKAYHGAQNADGRCIAARGFPYFCALTMEVFECIDLHFQHALQYQRICAVQHQLQPFFYERIIDTFYVRIERQQAFLADSGTPYGDMLHQCGRVEYRRNEYPAAHLHAEYKLAHRALQQYRSQCAPQHDEKRGKLDKGAEMAAFQRLPAKDGDQSDGNTDYAVEVHAHSLSLARNRATAWLCI